MTNTKTTKRALLTSVMALVLCFAMLLGTTFAWFTDSVTSGSNVIKTGNLDIEVEYTLDGTTWNDLDGADDLFQKGLWEPGHTEIVALKITNKGSLALKYTAKMNVTEETIGKTKDGDDIVLSELLKVNTITMDAGPMGDALLGYYFSGENALTDNECYFNELNVLTTEEFLEAGASKYTIVKVDMPTSVGNEANHDGINVPSIKFGINVLATQKTFENDSFGNQYDANTPTLVTSPAEAQAALDNATSGTAIQLMPGVNYGTLEFRANVAVENNKAFSTNENTVAVDYYTAKYPDEFVRNVENITIYGAPGATVDAIKFVTNVDKLPNGFDKNGVQKYKTIYRFASVKNLVIDSVEFTDRSTIAPGNNRYSPLLFNLSEVTVDGLTVNNCKLEGNNANMNFVYAYGGTTSTANFVLPALMKNVTLTNNTVSGIARFCELRAAENVTITGNVATDLADEFAQLASDSKNANTYAGNIIFADNTAENIPGQYVVIANAAEANIVIKNNVATNVCADYPEYVFDIRAIADGNTPVIENNTINN